MKIEVGNRLYFMYIIFALIYFVSLVLILRKRSMKTIRIVLIILLFLNLSLHFFKLAFPPYRDNMPENIKHSTLTNICAVSTVICPFIYLIKKHTVLHDYMFFICFCGGLGGLLYPTEALGHLPFEFNIIRFYICHATLIIVVLTAAILGLHRPRLKYFWAIPLFFLVHEGIIALNECVLIKTGLVKAEYSQLLDRSFRNSSFAFGVRPEFDKFAPLLRPLVPKFLKTNYFHVKIKEPFYFPVLWLTIPVFVYFIPIYVVITSPFWIATLVKNLKSKHHKN